MSRRFERLEDGRPYVIGIGGGTGSGKSTVAQLLCDGLRPLSTTVINQDQFFKDPAEMPTYFSSIHGEPRPDFNHPDSTDSAAMVAACQALLGPDVVLVEGILVLHYPESRALMHLLCYVDTEVEQMVARRTARNLAAGYGGTAEEIAHYNADCVRPQHQRFNAPSAKHADLLIPNSDHQTSDRDQIVAEIGQAIRELLER